MIRFDIRLAASGPVYGGLALGIVLMCLAYRSVAIWGIAVGAFFGAALALPLAAAFLFAAITVAFVLMRCTFAVQFGGFALIAAATYAAIVPQLNPMFFSLGATNDADRVLRHGLFFAASLTLSLICMATASAIAARAEVRSV